MRNPSLFIAFGSLVIVALLPRCGNGTTDCTQTSTCPSDASDGPPPLSCDTTKDPKDAPGCVDDRVGVFVSPTGSDTNTGTKASPFQTIGKALTSVGALTRVYVCEGTYSEDVSLAPPADGISIYGGFKCADWSYSGNKPTIGKGNIALKITGTTKPIAIEDLLIKSADGNAGSPSSIGALISGATAAVTFTRVNLTSGVGFVGPDGTAGSNYSTTLQSADPTIAGHNASGNAGGALQTCMNLCTDSQSNNPSNGGQGGAGGGAPSGGSGGAPALGGGSAGVVGACNGVGSGGDGNASTTAGVDAASPTTLGVLSATGWASGNADSGKNGSPGQGGGGGAGTAQGGGGGGACGGCGGGGGSGGSGGGGSIALAVVSSPVTVNSSELHAGDAGNGGKGGVGQVGQTGGAHGNGGGCSGGAGGNGSAGGTGAGGVGGISVGVLYKGSQPTIDGATTTGTTVGKAGTKGVGGNAGTNDGMDGIAQPSMQAP